MAFYSAFKGLIQKPTKLLAIIKVQDCTKHLQVKRKCSEQSKYNYNSKLSLFKHDIMNA